MEVYINSPILRSNYLGLQNMEITPYDIVFGVMEDVLDVSWDTGLCQLQGYCAFVVKSGTSLVKESPDISILELRQSDTPMGSKMLRINPLTR